MDKSFRRNKLDQALASVGIVSLKTAYFWLLKQERAGRLISPRDPINNHRKYTARQIEQIVKAFSPSGAGFWKPSSPPASTDGLSNSSLQSSG